MHPQTLPEVLRSSARRYGDRVALVSGDRELTFQQLDDRARRFAAHLQALGITSGDRVTLCAPNSIEWVVAYYGSLCAGAVISPLNALLTPEEVAFASSDCGAKVLIASAEMCCKLAYGMGADSLQHFLGIGEGQQAQDSSFSAAIASPAEGIDLPNPQPGDLAAILYTSGTTGHPKGAMITHRALLLNGALTAQMHGRSAQDTVITALPLPHVYGAAILNAAIVAGSKLVIHAQFKDSAILEDLVRHQATMFEGVPTMYYYLMANAGLDRYDLSSLRCCTVGGQTMPIAKMQEVEKRLDCPLIELWGMTELAGLGTTHASHATPRLGSIGVALPHMEMKIGALLPGALPPQHGEPGELLVRGPLVMKGYFANPAATRETIDEDGWLHTGDVGTQDSEGYFHVVDRKKDMILTAGYNVYPAEIERVIAAHPAVSMVAVGGLPDDTKGEIACAYVVLRQGHQSSADELVTHCREHLASYKVPRSVRFVLDLPKTSTGKVLRRELHRLAP